MKNIVIGVAIILTTLLSCTITMSKMKYNFSNKTYFSYEEAVVDMDATNQYIFSSIKPYKLPLYKKALFVIPTQEYVIIDYIKYIGSNDYIKIMNSTNRNKGESFDYDHMNNLYKFANYNTLKTYDLIKRKNIFMTIDICKTNILDDIKDYRYDFIITACTNGYYIANNKNREKIEVDITITNKVVYANRYLDLIITNINVLNNEK